MGTFTTRPELLGTYGMVSSTHWLASGAAMRLLERGGNAFDAAVAAGFVLQVVEPHLNGPGGDLPIVFWSRSLGKPQVICGQGPAPAAATIGEFSRLGLSLVPGDGLLPACVPGSFDAWMLMLRDFGTMGVADVLELAIGYSADGFPVVPGITAAVASVASLFESSWPTSAEVYLRDGVPQARSLFRNPALAETYRRIVAAASAAGGGREAQIDAARQAFYRGFVADEVNRFVETASVMDCSGSPHGGLLSGEDMASWSATYEDPITFDYDGMTVCKTGPWGQGPVFLQQLALLSNFDLRSMGLGSDDFIHTVVESAKLAFADREAWYGDPAFTDVPLDALLSPAYNSRRAALVGPAASAELRPGQPSGTPPVLPVFGEGLVAVGGGEPTLQPGDTCHLDVVDRFGNMVAATPSGGWLQSSPVIPSLGFCLGTRAQMFSLNPGLPNSLAPGKRPRTTLSPTLVLRDGAPALAFGTPGGDQQDQWSFAFFLAHTQFGLDMQAAIDQPSFHTAHFPSSFYPRQAAPAHLAVERRMPPSVVEALRRRGHAVEVHGDWTLGRMSTVGREADGLLKAAANPRGMQNYAIGR
jgi:gamma-glutamyltranspeptidase/glutathione hydrolase